MILSSEPDLTIRFDFPRFRKQFFVPILIGLIAFVEADGCFENKKNVVACTFDLADRFSNSLRV